MCILTECKQNSIYAYHHSILLLVCCFICLKNLKTDIEDSKKTVLSRGKGLWTLKIVFKIKKLSCFDDGALPTKDRVQELLFRGNFII